MAQNSSRAKRSEKGLLTPDNCVVAIIDLQPQIFLALPISIAKRLSITTSRF
jgi:hypothetical protein